MKDENLNASLDLDDLTQNDKLSPLDFKEPELRGFDASEIFELEETQPEKKSHLIFGKRSARRANVKIKENVMGEEESEEDLDITEPFSFVLDSREKSAPVTKRPAIVVNTEEEEEEPEETIEGPVEIEDAEEVVESEEEPVEIEEDKESDEDMEVVFDEMDEDEEEEPVEIEEDKELDEAMEVVFDEMDEDEEEEEDDSDHRGLYDDEEDLDLYEDKKRFLLSQYSIVEDYLHEQSSDGYHFVRHEGKKYYFVEGEPKNFYYSIDYFRDEPSDEQWELWERDGWKLISKEPGKRKKDAGWFIFRNYQKEGEYKKEIDNDDEKYRFFKKYSNSCRSTLFLIFICMFCCIVTAFLQYKFKGYLWGIGICAVVFLLSLIFFIAYLRMLRHSKKRVRLLKARLRVKESNRVQITNTEYNISESEEDLETDWNTIAGKEEKKAKKRRRKK